MLWLRDNDTEIWIIEPESFTVTGARALSFRLGETTGCESVESVGGG